MMPSLAHPKPFSPLPGKAIYLDIPTLRSAIKQIAEENGYAISADSKTLTKVSFICSKGGIHNSKNKTKADVLMPKDFKRRKNTRTIKTRCKYKVNSKPVPVVRSLSYPALITTMMLPYQIPLYHNIDWQH